MKFTEQCPREGAFPYIIKSGKDWECGIINRFDCAPLERRVLASSKWGQPLDGCELMVMPVTPQFVHCVSELFSLIRLSKIERQSRFFLRKFWSREERLMLSNLGDYVHAHIQRDMEQSF